MRFNWWLSVLVALFLCDFVFSFKHFYHGKHFKLEKFETEEFPPDQWFEQQLDHFDVVNNATWQQRYFTNSSFFKRDGPVFLQIGGEGEASPKWVVKGMMMEWANKFNALTFQLEHRFYGKSHPTKDMSTKNLRFLSSEQALADLAYFIESKNKEFNLSEKNRWIMFGGSYPGSLAAWFRLKYPHLAYGAVASSAPLLAQINFKEYLGVVTDALETTKQGSVCTGAIREAVTELENLIQSDTCCKKIEKSFRLCDQLDVDNDLDVANLFESLTGNFEGVVQYNKDNRDFSGANITIDTLCDAMTDSSLGSYLERYAVVNSLVLDTSKEECLDYKYDKFINEMRLTDWNSSAAEGGRQWTYQTCTEFGYYQSSDLERQPFGKRFPIEFSVRQCADIFGPKFNSELLQRAIDRTNAMYGGLALKLDRVVFPNGSIDPWHALGMTTNSTGNVPVYIQGTAHCADMYAPSEKDSTELIAARRIIENYLTLWLS